MIHDENAVSYGATWSPDGELILFTRWPMAGTFDLYTMEPDGNNLTQITETPDVDELYLDWGAAS